MDMLRSLDDPDFMMVKAPCVLPQWPGSIYDFKDDVLESFLFFSIR